MFRILPLVAPLVYLPALVTDGLVVGFAVTVPRSYELLFVVFTVGLVAGLVAGLVVTVPRSYEFLSVIFTDGLVVGLAVTVPRS